MLLLVRDPRKYSCPRQTTFKSKREKMTTTDSIEDGGSELGWFLLRVSGARVESMSDLKSEDLDLSTLHQYFMRFSKYLSPPSGKDVAMTPCPLYKEVCKRSLLSGTLKFSLCYTMSEEVIVNAPFSSCFKDYISFSFRCTT